MSSLIKTAWFVCLLGVTSSAWAVPMSSRQQTGALRFDDCQARAPQAISWVGLSPQLNEHRSWIGGSDPLTVLVICFGISESTTNVTVVVAALTQADAANRAYEVAEFIWTGGPIGPAGRVAAPPSAPPAPPTPPREVAPPRIAAPSTPSGPRLAPTLPSSSPPPSAPRPSPLPPSPGGGPTMLPLPQRVIDLIVGTWTWTWTPPGDTKEQSFGLVTFEQDGRAVWSGGSTGRWTQSGNTYIVVWPNSTDTMTLSADRNMLSGHNVEGWSGRAIRQ